MTSAQGCTLVRMLIEEGSPEALSQRLERERRTERDPSRVVELAALAELASAHSAGLAQAADILAMARHDDSYQDAASGIAAARRLFDAAARRSPEAAVALYSLGDPRLLDRATEELVERLDDWGVLAAEMRVLEIGCGIGRLARALAPRVAAILALDVSESMVAIARQRCSDLAGVAIEQTDGFGLPELAPGSLGLIVAIDSFPYIVQASDALAHRHIAQAASLLAPGGTLAIFNYSYRGDPHWDRLELAAIGAANGLAMAEPEQGLASWDAAIYRLRRGSGADGTQPVPHAL